MPDSHLDRLIDLALEEDVGGGDITTFACVPESVRARAKVVAKESIVVAGTQPFQRVFKRIDADVKVKVCLGDGERAYPGDTILHVDGDARAILSGERSALNFMMRLCGIATQTAHLVGLLGENSGVQLIDTRKTTPGWRRLEKEAVLTGGGHNHRLGLFDAFLIKENHVAMAGSIASAIQKARLANVDGLKIEIEVRDLQEVREALSAQPDIIMLDNMSDALTRHAVDLIRSTDELSGHRTQIEASGNMTAARLPAVAALGVDRISMGALTHSVQAADLSMLIDLEGGGEDA